VKGIPDVINDSPLMLCISPLPKHSMVMLPPYPPCPALLPANQRKYKFTSFKKGKKEDQLSLLLRCVV
jgi:hypothetical protein